MRRRADAAVPRTDGEGKEQIKMDEERDIAKNLAEALREVKDIRAGRKKGGSVEEMYELMDKWIAEVEAEEKSAKEKIAV